MLTTVEGVYRDGKVELSEAPEGATDGARVVVRFIQPRVVLPTDIDLRAHGTTREQAADLRARLMPFAEDWERPEMDLYDDYDAAKIALGPADTSPRSTR